MAAKKATKSAAKRLAKKAGNQAWAKAALPSGYAAINNGEFGKPWEFETSPVLEGTIAGDVREVETGTGKNKRMSHVVTVRTDDGTNYDVWESASLKGFFSQIEDGSQVAIAFKGYRDVGRPQPMKVFEAGIIEEDEKPARRKTAKHR